MLKPWKKEKREAPRNLSNRVLDPSAIRLLIFDFDGTLVDSLMILLEIYNQIAKEHGRAFIKSDELTQLRQLSLLEFLRRQRIPLTKLPSLLEEGRELFAERVEEIQYFPEIPSVISKLAKSYTLATLSSSPKTVLHSVLHREQLESFFVEIRSERDLLGKHHALKKLCSDLKIPTRKAIYIGDEARDVEAAQRAGCLSLAVTWGFTGKKRLQKANPSYLCDTPRDLLQFLSP